MLRKTAILALLVTFVAIPAVAQEEDKGPLTWVAFSQLNPGKTEDAVKLAMENKEFMDGLVADGTILSWGMATPINHFPDDTWNFVEWVNVANWAKVDEWFGRFMAHMQSIDEETMKSMQERGREIYVEGSHFDEIVRNHVFAAGEGETAMRFMYAAMFNAKDDKAMVKFFKEAVVPALDEMVADGTMTGYGIQSREIHVDSDWTHRFWYGLPGLASIDKMTAKFGEAMSPAVQGWAETVFKSKGHYDKVLMILHSSTNPEE
jgi:hypothetical protein